MNPCLSSFKVLKIVCISDVKKLKISLSDVMNSTGKKKISQNPKFTENEKRSKELMQIFHK